jgi:hypothetical protein
MAGRWNAEEGAGKAQITSSNDILDDLMSDEATRTVYRLHVPGAAVRSPASNWEERAKNERLKVDGLAFKLLRT